jgi:hypothetical protein
MHCILWGHFLGKLVLFDPEGKHCNLSWMQAISLGVHGPQSYRDYRVVQRKVTSLVAHWVGHSLMTITHELAMAMAMWFIPGQIKCAKSHT